MELFQSLDLLSSLQKLGSTTAVANRHRMSQSTVSKQLAALQEQVGFAIVEREGRKLRLTNAGKQLVEKALPISRALQEALNPKLRRSVDSIAISLGVAESILSTWGAPLVQSAIRRTNNLDLSLHSHRGLLVLERVLSGEYPAGIIAGTSHIPKSIEVKTLGSEPMVIIMLPPHSLYLAKNDAQAKQIPLITIEENSGTWKSIASRVARYKKPNLIVSTWVESFTSAAAMCEAGFGPALVPFGIANLLRVPSSRITALPGINREIAFVCRKRTLEVPEVQNFLQALRQNFPLFERQNTGQN